MHQINNHALIKRDPKNKKQGVKDTTMNSNKILTVLVVDQDPAFRAKVKTELDSTVREHQVIVQEAEHEAEGLAVLSVVRTHCVILGCKAEDQDLSYWQKTYHEAEGDLFLITATENCNVASAPYAHQNGSSNFIIKDNVNRGTMRRLLKEALHMKQLREAIEAHHDELKGYETPIQDWSLIGLG
jgi:DNA-binding NtrC family response regulator